jgi:ribosomal protein S18 acetylase RimI-like enzyme
MSMPAVVTIRRATADDAGPIAAIWRAVVQEEGFSAVDRAFTIDEERGYLQSLSAREAVFIAETAERQVIAFQSLDQWTKLFHSMDHVGQLGTFVQAPWRGLGVGRQLATQTLAFARSVGYEKLVIYVRASNGAAQAFYSGLGFAVSGRLTRQVRIKGSYDDELFMELFFQV